MAKPSLLARFPLEGRSPRPGQARYIEATHQAFERGANFVILEAPVGSGKSASAMTLALEYGSSHTLTPRKALQDQYFDDFHSFTHLMKGKSAYPCTRLDRSVNAAVYEEIRTGNTPSPDKYSNGISVQSGWCQGSSSRYSKCTAIEECPYSYAAVVAEAQPHIIHNVFGFLFQAGMAGKFSPREVLIVDEAHDLEGCLRDYFTIEFTLPKNDIELPDLETVGEWLEFFSQPGFLPRNKDDEEKYAAQLTNLAKFEDKDATFVIDVKRDQHRTYAKLIPRKFSQLVEDCLWKFGRRVVLMSATIYDHKAFCRTLGIPIEQTAFIRVESEFPIKYRPVLLKKEYQVDTSHAMWEDNFPDLVSTLAKILDKIPNEKGLVHTPSYIASEALVAALRAHGYGRVVTHNKDTTQDALTAFYASDKPLVLFSPSCQQGVDFNNDRARFQVIVRVPYLNAGDKFVGTMMKEDFSWYNLQALRIFGQQLGRINRHEKDYGVTILVDSRFDKFIATNKRYLPADVVSAIQRN